VTVKGKEAWANFASFFVDRVAPSIIEAIIAIMSFTQALGDEIQELRDVVDLPTLDEEVARSYSAYLETLNKSFKERGDIEGYNRAIIDLLDSMKDSPEILASFKKQFPEIFATYQHSVAGLDAALKRADASTLTFRDKQRKYANELREEFAGLAKEFDQYFDTPPEVEGPIVNVDQVEKQFEEAQDELTKILKDAEKDRLEAEREFWQDMGQITDDGIPPLMDVWNDYFSSTENLSVEAIEAQQDIWESQYGEFGDILNDALNKAMDIWRNYYQDLQDIARDEMNDIADENRDFQNSLEDNRRDMQQKLADAARKYRDEEIKAERDYQEKLRRLREEYLFDLEDALRERDALQVLRLMRRYALDKEQLERQNDLDAEQRAEDYRRELEDIRRQAAEKARELQIEHQRRLEEIAMQAQREREQAAIDRDRALQDLREDTERERQERLEKYKQEQQDLQDHLTERIKTLLEKYQEENSLTSAQLTQLENRLTEWATKTKLTHLDVAAAIHAATAQIVADLLLQQQMMSQATGIPYGTPMPGVPGIPRVNAPNSTFDPTTLSPIQRANLGFAQGGSAYATSPTLAMFGEGGPEIAQFTPVNRINTNSNSPIDVGGVGNGMNGKVHILVELGPDLEARIIDNTLEQSADIIATALGRRSSL
jgi:DNA repair exonuclease SbcCD ATPase subunit